jgi:hypothetical protein
MMAHDYEDVDDVDDLSDDELRGLVRERLAEHRALDIRDISVAVHDGVVALNGRVGTEGERRVAEHILTDVVGIDTVRNNLVVDALRRAESPEAVDEHLVDEDEHSGLLLGDRPAPLSPEADHLEEDLDARLFGTTDVRNAVENGTAWNPPTVPTQEGVEGYGATPADEGEDH